MNIFWKHEKLNFKKKTRIVATDIKHRGEAGLCITCYGTQAQHCKLANR